MRAVRVHQAAMALRPDTCIMTGLNAVCPIESPACPVYVGANMSAQQNGGGTPIGGRWTFRRCVPGRPMT